MKTFKFFTNNKPNYLEEEPTISRYDDYDVIVLNRIRYNINPVSELFHFEMGGENKIIMIRDIVHDYQITDTVTIKYQIYHINPTTPNTTDFRRIAMSVEEYNVVRYERV